MPSTLGSNEGPADARRCMLSPLLDVPGRTLRHDALNNLPELPQGRRMLQLSVLRGTVTLKTATLVSLDGDNRPMGALTHLPSASPETITEMTPLSH
jgi:hypothetical protein